jgi:hypothetical protein
LILTWPHVISTTLRAIQERTKRSMKKKASRSVRCHQETLPSLFWHCCTQSPAHATTAVVVVVASATGARLFLLLHYRRRLRPCHTTDCWRGPVSFPGPADVPANGTLGPRCLSMGPSRPPARRPRLGTLPRTGCTRARVLFIRSSGGGGGIRRGR